MAWGTKRSAEKAAKSNQPAATPAAAEQPVVPPPAPAPDQPASPLLDESKLLAAYANFARVTGTPEEVIIDFGLNPEPFAVPTSPIGISERIIVNFYTAKRLLAALHTTLERHEAAFGAVEVDIQKRLTQTPR